MNQLIAHARTVALGAPETVEKTAFASPAGKKRIAPMLASLLPAHSTYVEPFAGSAAVLFAKEPVKVEVLNDADGDIAEAYRAIKGLREADYAALGKMTWSGSKETYLKLREQTPSARLPKLHRFLYLTHFSYGKMRGRSFSPTAMGTETRMVDRLQKTQPRLKHVQVFSGDYEAVVRKFDGKDTLFFLDPPYAGYDAKVGEKRFDEARFFEVLKGIKGKWLLTYGVRGDLPGLIRKAGYPNKLIRTRRTIGSMRGVGGPSVLTQLLAANYDFGKVDKSYDAARAVRDVSAAIAIDAEIVKRSDEERFVLGVVLEPEAVDSQGDIYSADEVRQAAHRFMQEVQSVGLMHRQRVDSAVKIVESFIAPENLTVGDTAIAKGTWLLGVRVLDDTLWSKVKSGELSGFSIGGSARKEPVEP